MRKLVPIVCHPHNFEKCAQNISQEIKKGSWVRLVSENNSYERLIEPNISNRTAPTNSALGLARHERVKYTSNPSC